MLKYLRKGNNCVFGLSLSNQSAVYLFSNYQDTAYLFSVQKPQNYQQKRLTLTSQKAKSKVRMMFFEVKMGENIDGISS